MPNVIKRTDAPLFLAANRQWTSDISQAVRFHTLGEALSARARLGMSNVEVYDRVKRRPALSWLFERETPAGTAAA